MNKKYWLRFGTCLAIIFAIIFFIILLANYSEIQRYGLGGIVLVLIGLPLTLLTEGFIRILPSNIASQIDHSFFIVTVIVFIVGLINWFVIGSVLGFIYGKFKNRKQIS